MELPNLGKQCAECKQLDFLPFRCEGCSKSFCSDHRAFEAHRCSYQRPNVVVPTCPLCSQAVPIAKGDDADTKVAAHIDAGCPMTSTLTTGMPRQNLCALRTCRRSQLTPVRCKSCNLNFCLKHRHAQDHECSSQRQATTSVTRDAPQAGTSRRDEMRAAWERRQRELDARSSSTGASSSKNKDSAKNGDKRDSRPGVVCPAS